MARNGKLRRVRHISLIVAAAVVGAGLSACSSSSSAGESGDITLRYSLWDPGQAPVYEEIAKEFEKENPGVRVQVETLPWASYWTKLYTQSSTGTQPDVFWAMPAYLPELVAKKAMLPLDDLITKDDVTVADAIPVLTEAYKVDGTTYGIQKDWDSLGILYNSDQLAEAGYDAVPENLEWNPDDGGSFVKFLEDLTLDANGKHPDESGFDANNIQQYGYAYFGNNVDTPDLAPWIYSNGGEIIDSSGAAKVDSPENVETIGFLRDLVHKYHVAPDYAALLSATPFSLFAAGKVAAWQTGPFNLSEVDDSGDFTQLAGPFPAGPAGKWTRVNGIMDAVSAATKHQEEAWAFAKFITTPEAQKLIGESGTMFPTEESGQQAMAGYWADKGTDLQSFIDSVRADDANVIADPVVPNYLEFLNLWSKTVGEAIEDKRDVADAMRTIQTEGSQIISK